MLSKPISTQVIFALALAILMAWAGHTSALFMGASQQAGGNSGGAHSHAHDDSVFTCAACADHYHSSLTADHVHETPHLTMNWSNWSGHPGKPHTGGIGGVHDQEDATSVLRRIQG
jgi:hypothetical protein